MGSRLGWRVVHFANLPIKLLMPSSFNNIKEISLKTIPSASKIEIKRVLESLYGFDVDKVRTLNMDGKKRKGGGVLIAKPDYKKAYVTLKSPISISPDLYPLRIIEEEKKRINKQSKSSLVEEGETTKHWLDGKKESEPPKFGKQPIDRRGNRGRRAVSPRRDRSDVAAAAKFPWSSMKSGSGAR